jgi:hypothetical protein
MKVSKIFAATICALIIGGSVTLNAAEPTLDETHEFINKMIRQSGAKDFLRSLESYIYQGCQVEIAERADAGWRYVYRYNLADISEVQFDGWWIELKGRVEKFHSGQRRGTFLENVESKLRIYFDSGSRAQRVANALGHARTMCAGDQKDPF